MQIFKTAHKQLQKLHKNDAIRMINALLHYEKNQKGYIKWLENRPGYRIKIDNYHVIFEFQEEHNEIFVLELVPMPTNT